MDKVERKTKDWNGRKCPYSDSCFTCPLPDCEIGMTYAQFVNKLPVEKVGNRRVILGEGKNAKYERARAIKKRAKEVAERRGRHTTNNK